MDFERTSTRQIPGVDDRPRHSSVDIALADAPIDVQATPARPALKDGDRPLISERTHAVNAVVDPDAERNDALVRAMMPDLAMAYLAANGALDRAPSASRHHDDAIERVRARQAGQSIGCDIHLTAGATRDRAQLLTSLITPADGKSISQVRIGTINEHGTRSWSVVEAPRSEESMAAMLTALDSGGSIEIISRAKAHDSIRDAIHLAGGQDVSVNGVAFSPRQMRRDLVDAARSLHADTAHPDYAHDAARIQFQAAQRLHEVADAYRTAAQSRPLPAMSAETAGFLDADRLGFAVASDPTRQLPAGWSHDENAVTYILTTATEEPMAAERMQDARVTAWLAGFSPATPATRVYVEAAAPADLTPAIDTIMRIDSDRPGTLPESMDHDRVMTEKMPAVHVSTMTPQTMALMAGVADDARTALGFGTGDQNPVSLQEVRSALHGEALASLAQSYQPESGTMTLALAADPQAAEENRETLLAGAIVARQAGQRITAVRYSAIGDDFLRATMTTVPVSAAPNLLSDDLGGSLAHDDLHG